MVDALIADEGVLLHTGDSDMERGVCVPQGAGILGLLSHKGYKR